MNKRTTAEVKMANLLKRLKIKYIEQWNIDKYYYDFKLLDYKILIEVDGSIHRKYSRIKNRDSEKNTLAINNNMSIIRIRNSELCNISDDEFKQMIDYCSDSTPKLINTQLVFNKNFIYKTAL